MEQKYDIFISYRRDGGDKYARIIQQALEKQFRVFLDFDELEDGVFDQRIIDAISSSPVFLLVLSKGALDRCVNEKDWVRQEILQAVKCGCHIVPVTIIGNDFEGLPEGLPEELRSAIGSHQFSQLHVETLFKESIAKLVKARIVPYIHREDTDVGAEIHIETNAECQLFHFKKSLAIIYEGQDNVVRLKRGKHKLEFVSVEYEDIKDQIILEIPDEDYTDFIEVEMKERIEAKQKAEEENLNQMVDEARNFKSFFKMSAGTNVGLIQTSNNDNFVVCSDISSHNWLIPMSDDFADLGELGALLVVADGENNAGDVASAIAVNTIQEHFFPETIYSDSVAIQRFMIEILKIADINIYNRSQTDPKYKGMCSSIAMAYVIGTKVYVCWCGNCRCYVFNKKVGLTQISKDHSYVQELVDKGIISSFQAYNHPLSKRITNCLGDNDKRVQPECRVYNLHDEDYIIVCSDGLTNLVRDEHICDYLNVFQDSPMECKNELISAALANGGNDNVTVALMKVKIADE